MPQYYSLKQVAEQLLPPKANGRHITSAAVWNWVTVGVAGIKLKALCAGGQWLVTAEDLNEFLEAVAEKKISNARQKQAARKTARQKAVAKERAKV